MAASTTGLSVKFVRDARIVLLEKILVDAVVLIKEPQSGFKAFGEGINGSAIQAFIVDAVDLENDAQLACLGQEDLIAR